MIKKYILPIILVIILMFNVTIMSYKTASATGGFVEVPLIIKGVAGAGAMAGGLTVGTILAATLGVVAVGYGTYLVVDNWDDITYHTGRALNNATGKVKSWWDNITGSAVKKDEPTVPLPQQLSNENNVINFFDYYVPSGGNGDNNPNNNIEIDGEIAGFLTSVLLSYYGYTELKPGNTNTMKAQIDRIFQSYGAIPEDYSFMDFHHFIIFDAPVISGTEIIRGFRIVTSNNDIPLERVDYYSSNYVYGFKNYQYEYDYLRGKFNGKRYKATNYFSVLTQKNDTIIEPKHYANKIIFTNQPIKVLQTGAQDIPPLYKEVTIQPSQFKWTENNTEFVPQTIVVNDYLVNELENQTTKTIKSTDDIVNVIKQADTKARINHEVVLTKQIVNQSEPIPTPAPVPDLTNKGFLEGIKDFFRGLMNRIIQLLESIYNAIISIPSVLNNIYNNILDLGNIVLNAIKTALAWLFVPSNLAVEQFVNRTSNKMNNQFGILTYPITLVIRFLTEVLQLGNTDCILVMPEIALKGFVLSKRTEFNFTEFVKRSEFAHIYTIYRTITNYIMIIALLGLAVKKGDQCIRGK